MSCRVPRIVIHSDLEKGLLCVQLCSTLHHLVTYPHIYTCREYIILLSSVSFTLRRVLLQECEVMIWIIFSLLFTQWLLMVWHFGVTFKKMR